MECRAVSRPCRIEIGTVSDWVGPLTAALARKPFRPGKRPERPSAHARWCDYATLARSRTGTGCLPMLAEPSMTMQGSALGWARRGMV